MALSPTPNLVEIEKEMAKRWEKQGLLKKYLEKNKDSKKKWSFLDGPITANNPMGVHHARGRTYKDLFQRYKNMQGFKQKFQNGFDCQGLWVEVEVEKELGFKNKKEIEDYGVAKFVQKCKDRVNKYAGIQTEQSKRLGMFMDWENSYFTMSDENNYAIWHFLKVCWEKGWLYKGQGSVPWCPRCETAISQHEILTENYKEVVHESVYLKLRIIDSEEFLLVWTTTPWTLPANVAVAVDEKMDYILVEIDNERYWVAEGTQERVFKNEWKIVKKVKGKELVGLKYKTPFDDLSAVKKAIKKYPDKFHVVVATDKLILPIGIDEGTGLVHTAVGAGTEDFRLGKKLGLPVLAVIEDDASYMPGFDWLTGKNAKKDPRLILDYLDSDSNKFSWAFKIEKYKHRYPGCWRCKTELVWKVTDEWYIAMDKGKPSFREQMKKSTREITWKPSFGLERELDWLNNMHDWMISKKNRFWGLCLPIYECSKCGHFEVMGSKDELKERAIEGWEKFEGHTPHKPYMDEVKIKCSKCGEKVKRVEPVGNPWLDAGIVSFSTDPKLEWFPADFITECFPGQFKNWFYSLIAMSTALKGQTSYKNLLGFESVVGQDGREMHKSLGNAIEFNQGAEEMGVDVMRWLYTRTPAEQRLAFGPKPAGVVRRKFHLILYNSVKYWLLFFDPGVSDSKVSVLDRWIISRLESTVKTVTKELNKYELAKSSLALEELVTDLSTWYIRRSRDRKDKGFEKTMGHVLNKLLRMLAPFVPYLSDYLYGFVCDRESQKLCSVHLTEWPKAEDKLIDKELEEKMKQIRKVCELGHAARKEDNLPVRQPLAGMEAKGLTVQLGEELIELIKKELNVKGFVFETGSGMMSVKLDTELTPELKKEGEVRGMIREIQNQRRKLKIGFKEKIKLGLPLKEQEYIDQVVEKCLVSDVYFSKTIRVEPAGN